VDRVANEDRPVTVPRFGHALRAARGARTPQSVVAKMHQLSAATAQFTRPQLDRYEAGRTWRPDPVPLYYMARLYGADLLEWIEILADERNQRALDADSDHGTATPGPASARGRRASSG
jgi:hypothetical protein